MIFDNIITVVDVQVGGILQEDLAHLQGDILLMAFGGIARSAHYGNSYVALGVASITYGTFAWWLYRRNQHIEQHGWFKKKH